MSRDARDRDSRFDRRDPMQDLPALPTVSVAAIPDDPAVRGGKERDSHEILTSGTPM
jgi:hypothetical protein